MKTPAISSRDLALCGVFGAMGMLLPVVFHLLQLGKVLMPMYLPLVALAFFVRPIPAGITAFSVPLLSALLTNMPPFFPPVAVIMAVELSVMGMIIAAVRSRRPGLPTLAVLVPVLLLGRVLGIVLIYGMALAIDLPAAFVAGASLISGWPGIILMIAVIPPLVRLVQHNRISDAVQEIDHEH